jgi:ubiquinone/menaquinone biosynthesis C-methylase UbiE
MENAEKFFEFAAEVGLTKHLGNVEATNRMADLCQIKKGSYILDVGCGSGATAAYLARSRGCEVMGVDILPRMIDRAKELADRKGVTRLAEFRVADALDLPFSDRYFDAVITESVTAFPEDKNRAVGEYFRVLKYGGFLGLNETTWLKTPVPAEIKAWASQEVGGAVIPLTAEGWTGLLREYGFNNLVTEIREVNIKKEARGMLARYGFAGMVRILKRTFKLYRANENYRNFLKNVNQGGLTPEDLTEYFGYGIYVGRK